MAETDLTLVSYCGMNCAACFGYTQEVSEAAKGLRRALHATKMKQSWSEIPFLGEYEPFKQSLDGLAMLRCPRACRGGGGPPYCKIRKCCQKKALDGCWECADTETCDKLTRYKANVDRIKKVGLEKAMAAQVKKRPAS